jgi:large subunit ribosomal protein L24
MSQQPRLKVKKGDTVMVISGKDKGKTGKVIESRPSSGRVVVDGVAVAKKHRKARGTKKPGGIMDVPQPVNVSNVMLMHPSIGKPVKVRTRRVPLEGKPGKTRPIRCAWVKGQQVDIEE